MAYFYAYIGLYLLRIKRIQKIAKNPQLKKSFNLQKTKNETAP